MRKMRQHKRLLISTVVLAMFLMAIPSLAPMAYGAAEPCLTTSPCALVILSPGSGGALNNNQTVYRSFIVSFTTKNFSLVQPGTGSEFNTTTGTGPGAHNEGHVHVFVDNVYVTIWANTNGIPLTLSKGTHTITLELVNSFHQSFNPKISKSTTVSVVDPSTDSIQSTASNAQNFSLGALVLSLIAVILVAYVAFRPKQKPTA